jgi:hypothetical protein
VPPALGKPVGAAPRPGDCQRARYRCRTCRSRSSKPGLASGTTWCLPTRWRARRRVATRQHCRQQMSITSSEIRRTGVAQAGAHARPIAAAEHKPARHQRGSPSIRLIADMVGLHFAHDPRGDRRGAPNSRDSTTKHTGLQGLRRPCAFAVTAVGCKRQETAGCGPRLLPLAQLRHRLPGLEISAGAQARVTSPAQSVAVPRRRTRVSSGSVTRTVSEIMRPTGAALWCTSALLS